MRILATSNNEGNSTRGARGGLDQALADALQAHASSSSSSSSALTWVVQSVLSGISAGICYHILQERKKGRYQIDVLTVASKINPLKLVNSVVRKCWGRTSETMGRIPRWFWMSAPSYLVVFCSGVFMSSEFFDVSLFFAGNMLFWGRYRRNQVSVGGDGDASPVNRESSTKAKPHRVDPPLTEHNHHATLKEELESLMMAECSLEKGRSRLCCNTADTGNKSVAKKKGQHQQYLELMVHNVSHSDLVLSLEGSESFDVDSKPSEIYIRPRFSFFHKYSRMVLDQVQSKTDEVIFFPRYQRSMEDPRYAIQPFPADWDPPTAPTGFRLANHFSVDRDTLQQDVRVRARINHCSFHLCKSHISPLRYDMSTFLFWMLSLLPTWER